MSSQVHGLFDDPRVIVLSAPLDDGDVAALSPREREATARMRDKRLKEYATGRALAREGLARFFGVRGFDLVNAEDRSPIWPEGIAGSLSHCDTRAWVALAPRALGTIGIDGEHRAGLKPELWRHTMLDEEIAALEALDGSIREVHALALFSAKEALYKAQHPRSRTFMGFHALHVALDGDRVRCTFQEEVGPFPAGFVAHGRWRLTEGGELLTAVWIPEPAG